MTLQYEFTKHRPYENLTSFMPICKKTNRKNRKDKDVYLIRDIV